MSSTKRRSSVSPVDAADGGEKKRMREEFDAQPDPAGAQLPPKILPTGKWQNAGRVQLTLNSYALDVSKAVESAFKYELKFWGERKPREGEEKKEPKDLSRPYRQNNDVSKQWKRHLLWAMFRTMVESNKDTFPQDQYDLAYDCGINLYSLKALVPVKEKVEFELPLDLIKEKLAERPDVLHYIRPMVAIKAVVVGVGEAQLRGRVTAPDPEGNPDDRSPVQFLDILLDQDMQRHDRRLFFAHKSYAKDSVIPAGNNDPRILKAGMEKNVKVVGDSPATATAILQIDPKKSAFFPEVRLDEYIEQFLGDFGSAGGGGRGGYGGRGGGYGGGRGGYGGGGGGLENMLINNATMRKSAANQIKKICVVTTHLGKNKSFEVQGLTQESAGQLAFVQRDGTRVTVQEYMERQYSLRIQRPGLPCAIEDTLQRDENGNRRVNFYPLELLRIVGGQRIQKEKETPSLSQIMLRACAIAPAAYPAAIEEQRQVAVVANSNQHLKKCGIRVANSGELMKTQAEVLFAPAITYSQNGPAIEPSAQGQLQWKMGRSQFVEPAPEGAARVWCAVLVGGGFSGDEMNQLVTVLRQAANQRGLMLPAMAQGDQLNDSHMETLRERFTLYKQHNVGFVFVVASDAKTDAVHHRLKLLEAETGIVTQHISQKTARKAIGDPQRGGRPSPMVQENILFKLNQKLGGVNNGFTTPREFARLNNITYDIVNKEWLHPSRMFLGLDLSHPGAQSRSSRAADEEKGVQCREPTVVGCAYSLGQAGRAHGTFWMQQTRLGHIIDLQPHIEDAVKDYREAMGSWPRHLIVFRGGVSDGEYYYVLTKEKEAFDRAFRKLQSEHSDFKNTPYLTILVVQQSSNYRLIPVGVNANARETEQNVRPGTCIDRGVMDARYTEFLLTPHQALKGTARNIRCTVIADTAPERVSVEELEQVTNILCYAHGIVTSPISLPSPLHSASDLAKRGRNNWKIANYDGDDAESTGGSSGGRGGRFKPESGEDDRTYWRRVSVQLRPTTTQTKFWA